MSRIPVWRALSTGAAILMIILSSATVSVAQEIPVQLEQALTSGNSKQISRMFDGRVEIVLDKERRDYSQQQAVVVLNDFLSRLENAEFEMIHEGTSQSQSTYYIAKLTSSSAAYRVYVTVSQAGGSPHIQSIKFEKQ